MANPERRLLRSGLVVGAFARVALAWLALTALAPAHAFALDPAVTSAKTAVSEAVSEWDAARAQLQTTRASSETLAHRIARLKQVAGRGGGAGVEGELERLLRESLRADAAMTRDARAVEVRARQVLEATTRALQVIDQRIEALKPRLHQGELESKKNAARSLAELRSARRDVKDFAARIREDAPLPKAWSRYEVKIDPLDGPKELAEKADFVEDTRDQFQKKLTELRRVIQEARRERDLTQAAAEFQTDTRLFDEESRSARVARQGSRASDASDNRAPAGGVESQGSGNGTGRDPVPAADGLGGNADSPTPPQSIPGSGSGMSETNGTGGVRTPPTTPPPASAPTFSPAAVTKADPNVLLNLRVDSLDTSGRSLAELETLAQDLERLQSVLDGRSKELRRRAEQLRADEARALGTK